MARKQSPLQAHRVTVKQHDGSYRADCGCGEQLGTNHAVKELARRAGERHQRQVVPHLCGPQS